MKNEVKMGMDKVPYSQICQLAELAWKLGIDIKQIKLLDNYIGIKEVETPYMKIKIK